MYELFSIPQALQQSFLHVNQYFLHYFDTLLQKHKEYSPKADAFGERIML